MMFTSHLGMPLPSPQTAAAALTQLQCVQRGGIWYAAGKGAAASCKIPGPYGTFQTLPGKGATYEPWQICLQQGNTWNGKVCSKPASPASGSQVVTPVAQPVPTLPVVSPTTNSQAPVAPMMAIGPLSPKVKMFIGMGVAAFALLALLALRPTA